MSARPQTAPSGGRQAHLTEARRYYHDQSVRNQDTLRYRHSGGICPDEYKVGLTALYRYHSCRDLSIHILKVFSFMNVALNRSSPPTLECLGLLSSPSHREQLRRCSLVPIHHIALTESEHLQEHCTSEYSVAAIIFLKVYADECLDFQPYVALSLHLITYHFFLRTLYRNRVAIL